MNVKFNYLYRDEGNYKDWGSTIFSNELDWHIPDFEKAVRKYLDGREFFIASELDLPIIELYRSESSNLSEIGYYEFDCIELTKEEPNDPKNRTFLEFMRTLKKHDFSGILKLTY